MGSTVLIDILTTPIPLAGHNLAYHLSIKEAVESIGWEYQGWMSENIPFDGMPAFRRKFPKMRSLTGYGSRFKKIRQNIAPFKELFSQVKKEKKYILLLEQFDFCDLIAIGLTFLILRYRRSFRKKNVELWLVHRYPPEQTHWKGFSYKVSHKILKLFLGENRLKFFTDSALLAQRQGSFYGLPVHVLPIPHTKFDPGCSISKQPNKLYCWWGTSLRFERGLEEIQQISEKMKNVYQGDFVLVLPSSLQTTCFGNHIHWIAEGLSRKEYDAWLTSVDIALLPYSRTFYRERSSGIFVEAIVAGIVPFVTSGTWMAYELSKFELGDLVVDWSMPDLMKHILVQYRNVTISEKLAKMREFYKRTHSLEQFAATLQNIANSKGKAQ